VITDPTAGVSAPQPALPGYPGPYPVGRYAAALRDRLRAFSHVAVEGEACGVRLGSGPNVYFELRDRDGGLPCAMWRTDFDRLGLPDGALCDGTQLLAAGGLDYYPGGASASPRLQFRVRDLRLAGEGDLLARLARLRRELRGEGLFAPQKALPRALLPRRIGVVTAPGGAARRDLLAGLERRGWRGTIVWADVPVQDRRAAPAIGRALSDLAAYARVETIVVCRGGGSIADLWAFCDEGLCREVALLAVPVISAVGHESDRTLIDDVAAVACSTPTHAAEAAVAIDCNRARVELRAGAARLERLGRRALASRARALAAASRAPREHAERERRHLHQKARELRAASARGLTERGEFQRRVAATVIERKRAAARVSAAREHEALLSGARRLARACARVSERSAEALRGGAGALRSADPERTLERGFALALDRAGEPLTSAAALRSAEAFELQLSDGRVPARIDPEEDPR
jgi:exodeoxyribonuclease VII large subunit